MLKQMEKWEKLGDIFNRIHPEKRKRDKSYEKVDGHTQ